MDGGRRVKLVAAVAVLENRSAKGERSTQIKLLILISRDEKVNLAIFPTMLPGKASILILIQLLLLLLAG